MPLNSLASFNILQPHLSSRFWFWSLPAVFKSLLGFSFSFCQTWAPCLFVPALLSCLERLVSDHGDLHLAMPEQPWSAFYSEPRGKEAFGKLQYSAFWSDSFLNNAIYYDAYRLLVSGSGYIIVLITILLSGLIDLRIIIQNPAGHLCSTVSCFYVCPSLFCVIMSEKIIRKRLLLVTGINLTGGSRERSPIFSSRDMSSGWSWLTVLDCLLEFQFHHMLPVSPTCTRKRRNKQCWGS